MPRTVKQSIITDQSAHIAVGPISISPCDSVISWSVNWSGWQQRLGSACTSVQADLSLGCQHIARSWHIDAQHAACYPVIQNSITLNTPILPIRCDCGDLMHARKQHPTTDLLCTPSEKVSVKNAHLLFLKCRIPRLLCRGVATIGGRSLATVRLD